MTSKIVVLGNGESRKSVDLQGLRDNGAILYGCNAIYRDFTVDGLVCVDGGMMHEVYDSGYALTNQCYFRSWTRLPEYSYDMLIDLDMLLDWPVGTLVENKKGSRKEFVMNGTDPNQMKRLYDYHMSIGSDKTTVDQLLLKHHLWVTWVDEHDMVELIDDNIKGWSAGPIAVKIALDKHQPSEVYLLGFDLKSNDGLVNNVYKGTANYVTSDAVVTPSTNWIKQHAVNFKEHPDVTFYKVNTEELNFEVPEWSEFKNVKYILQKDIGL